MLKKVFAYFQKMARISETRVPSRISNISEELVPEKEAYTRRPKGQLNSIRAMSCPSPTAAALPTTKVTKLKGDDRIVWIDLEMTGLDINNDVIMEIGCIITGPNLDEITRHPEIVIKVNDSLLDSMETWCRATHGSSGLTEQCRRSTVSIEEAEDRILSFLQKNTESNQCPMGGSSNWMDRCFLQKFMPRVSKHLHYRNIDVSTIKELVERWYPAKFKNAPIKRQIHRTIPDLEDSIKELEFYKSKVFLPPISNGQA